MSGELNPEYKYQVNGSILALKTSPPTETPATKIPPVLAGYQTASAVGNGQTTSFRENVNHGSPKRSTERLTFSPQRNQSQNSTPSRGASPGNLKLEEDSEELSLPENHGSRRPSGVSISSEDGSEISDSMICRLPRAQSTDSIDSTLSTFESIEQEADCGQLESRIQYHREDQLLNIWILQGYQLRTCTPQTDVWVVIFLLPHAKPLFRTQISSGSKNPQFHVQFQQRVKESVLRRLALLCQVYARDRSSPSHEEATMIGHAKVRLKDFNLVELNNLWLTLRPTAMLETESSRHDYGEAQFSLSYLPSSERLTVVITKLRNIRREDGAVPAALCIRAYLVHGPKKIAKKKTSVQESENGSVFYNESIIFSLPQRYIHKVFLRLSITERLDAIQDFQTIGHVTVGSRCTEKALGHWNQMIQNPRKPVTMWHPIRAKKFM